MKKRILAFGLVAVLSVSMLAGCGSKKDPEKGGAKVDKTIFEVAENVAKNIGDIESMKLGVKGNIDMTGKSEGIEMVIKGNAELNGTFTIDVPAFNMEGKLSYEMGGVGQKVSGDYSATVYGETEGDTMNVYAKTNITDWKMESINVSEYIDAMSELKSDIGEFSDQIGEIDSKELEEQIGEYFKLEDRTKVVNGKECYVLSADMDLEDLISLIEMTEGKTAALEDTESLDEMNFSYGICIDTKTYVPVKVYADITAKGADGDTEFNINAMGFEFNFVVNEGKVKDVPKDVKEEAETVDSVEDNDFDSIIKPPLTTDDLDDNHDDDSLNDDTGVVDSKYIPKSFKLEGKEYKIGDKAGAFIEAGYEVNKEWTEVEKISPDSEENIYLTSPKNNDAVLMITVLNDTDSEIDIKDAVICGINIEAYTKLSFELDNGIKSGSSFSDVQKIYEGQKIYDKYDGVNIFSVEYEDENYNSVEYTYDTESKVLTEIDLDYFDLKD